jgi:DNA excision repair protein ERCC-2
MTLRFDDEAQRIDLSVRDLAEAAGPSGHLTLTAVQRLQTRAAQGRDVHLARQERQAAVDAHYQAEVRLQHTVEVDGWTVVLHGRVDGLTTVEGHTVVEEIKSTVLDAGRLFATTVDDWPSYVSQLEVYLWMLHEARHDTPVGRLVLVSVADGAQHVLGVRLDADDVSARVATVFATLVERRQRRIAWMEARRAMVVPAPHEVWRPGQEALSAAVHSGLQAKHRVLAEAPTGLGKTAAVLHGVLRHALAHDQQVFWATARTTQQRVPLATVERFAQAGLPLRAVRLRAREKGCLNDVVACHPDHCPYARAYHDKVREARLLEALVEEGHVTSARLEEVGRAHEVCPVELGLDLSSHVDVVVGDYNYVFDPTAQLRRHFGDAPSEAWVVVFDEAHHLVDRARGWLSPHLEARQAQEAADQLALGGEALQPFVRLARQVEGYLRDEVHQAPLPERDDLSRAYPDVERLRALADRIDALGIDYALQVADHPHVPEGDDDAWLTLARATLRMSQRLDDSGDETVPLLRQTPGDEALQLLCLDPSGWLGPRIARLGGWVGLSATLSPTAFYVDLLGLGAQTDAYRVASPFDAARRPVFVAPRVSTMWRDRRAHAQRTAELLQAGIEAVPGNVAVYFPSFDMLDDLVGRLTLARPVLRQERGLDDEARQALLDGLSQGDPVVLAAVLGGVFAEGIDLPPGALDAVMVVGPALPPVGLERDLLRACYEARYGEGFAYASLVPGLTKVVQAAGRLIRRPDDRGVVWLVGRRFRWTDVAALLPDDWAVEIPDDPVAATHAFFSEGTLSP